MELLKSKIAFIQVPTNQVISSGFRLVFLLSSIYYKSITIYIYYIGTSLIWTTAGF